MDLERQLSDAKRSLENSQQASAQMKVSLCTHMDIYDEASAQMKVSLGDEGCVCAHMYMMKDVYVRTCT